MGFFDKLFESDKKPIQKPSLYELGSTIASIINFAFIAQEGLNSLLKPPNCNRYGRSLLGLFDTSC